MRLALGWLMRILNVLLYIKKLKTTSASCQVVSFTCTSSSLSCADSHVIKSQAIFLQGHGD